MGAKLADKKNRMTSRRATTYFKHLDRPKATN